MRWQTWKDMLLVFSTELASPPCWFGKAMVYRDVVVGEQSLRTTGWYQTCEILFQTSA